MTPAEIERIDAWLIREGLAGAPEVDLLAGFCERCLEAGIPLSRGVAAIDTLHPIYEGRAIRWRNDGVKEEPVVEYGRTNEGEAADNWRRSVFFHLSETGGDEFRCRLSAAHSPPERFPGLATMQKEGVTDYLALIHRFGQAGSIGEMDCIYTHWTSGDPAGFRDADIAAMRRLIPPLALAIKCVATARLAGNVVEAYLGRDPGRRVMSGRIARGIADRIGAVLWFSDLRGYSTISDTASPDEIIPLLNDYAEAVISAIHAQGGDVLKLMGDGTLAIFAGAAPDETCRRALKAEAGLRERLAVLNERRAAEGRPVTSVYLGLHVGEVLYGNIGSQERLDFTVVGPAVNEVSRIANMCRSADRPMLVSADFCAASPPEEKARLVSVGRYALRGFERAQELFTLDPGEV